MSLDTVVGKDGFAAALAGNADERLIVGRDVEVLVNNICIVFGSCVEIYKEVDRVLIEVSLSISVFRRTRVIGQKTVVIRLDALRKSGNYLRIGLDQTPFAVLAQRIGRSRRAKYHRLLGSLGQSFKKIVYRFGQFCTTMEND